MAAEEIAGLSGQLSLHVDAFVKQLEKAHSSAIREERGIQRAFDQLTGVTATKEIERIDAAVRRAGGTANLTAQQLDNLRGRVEALAKAGAKLPASLAKLGPSTGATLSANVQQQALGGLQSQLGPAGALLGGLSGGALAAAAGIGAVAVAAGAAASAVADATVEFAQFAGNLQDLSAQTGIGVEALQELAFAGSFVNVSMDEMAGAVGKMQRAIAEGDSVFQRLGLNLEQLETLAPEEQFFKVAEAINSIRDPAERTAAAVEVFGKSGASLLPLFGNLQKLREEAHRLGVVFDADAIEKGDELDDAFTRLGAATEALQRQLGKLAGSTGLIAFLENLAEGVGKVSANLPRLLDLLSRVAPLLSQIAPGAGALTSLGTLAGLASRAGASGGEKFSPAPAQELARRTIQGTQFETAREEAERKKAEEAARRAAEAQAKAAEKTRAAWQEAAEKARVEWDKFFKDMEAAGGEAEAAMRKDATKATAESAKRNADLATEAFMRQIDAVAALGETFKETEAKLLPTFNLLKQLQGGLGSQTTTGLREMGAQFAAVAADSPKLAAALAEINAELERRGEKPIVSDEEISNAQELIQTLGELSGILGQLPGLVEAFGVSADSALGKAVAGFSEVGQAALGFSATLADPSASIFSKIGAGINLGTSLIKSIGGLFKQPSWKKVASDAGKVFGDELGRGIDEELAKAIEKTAEDLGLSNVNAALLHIGDAMDESSESAVAFGDEMSTLLSGIADGTIPAKEGVEALGDAFGRLAEEAEAGSVAAQASMGALAAQARAAGQSIPEIEAAVGEAVNASTEALAGLGGLKILDVEDAASQAAIFANVFAAKLATDGIVAAAQAIQPALKVFTEQLKAAGVGQDAVAAILGPINAGMSLLKNDLTKGGAEGAQALKTIIESQLKAGFLDVNTFAAIQQQAGTAFDQMIEGGAATGAALQAVAPLLAQIQQTAQATGAAVDPVTQGLLEQAKAAGIAFPEEPIQRVVTLLESIATALGATVPAATETAANTITTQVPAAVGAASSSLQTLTGAATASSSSIVAAFDGIGAQITTAIAPAANSIQQGFVSAFDAASQGASAFINQLSAIAGKEIGLNFKFGTGGGELDGFNPNLPQLAGGSGGVKDWGRESIVALHGREAVVPEGDFNALTAGARSTQINYAPTVRIDGSGLNEEQLLRVVSQAIKSGKGGVRTAIRRANEGKD